jgi:hypothetical protein
VESNDIIAIATAALAVNELAKSYFTLRKSKKAPKKQSQPKRPLVWLEYSMWFFGGIALISYALTPAYFIYG